ncbi:MAG: hypothetical protein R2849_06510 [Thermomicrobiales bacterium]
MNRTIRCFAAIFVVVAMLGSFSGTVSAQQPTEYDGVEFPQGDISFADRVVSFTPGPGVGNDCTDGSFALGVPDHTSGTCINYLSLGNTESVCQGELILEFRDNYLIDIDGDDLYIFEIGAAVEATDLYISNDGRNWISIGKIEARPGALISPIS